MEKKDKNKDDKTILHIDPQMESGIYANAANIIHSPNEFIMDFIMVLPGDRKKVVSRTIISPAHAKQLASALLRNVEKFESIYGEIEMDKRGPETEFSGPIN